MLPIDTVVIAQLLMTTYQCSPMWIIMILKHPCILAAAAITMAVLLGAAAVVARSRVEG